MRFPFFRNRDSVKNGILISIRRTGDGFHPGLFNDDETIQGKCAAKARDIMWNSTEKKAVYLTKMLVTMAENLDSVM